MPVPITRRQALRTLALASAALALPHPRDAFAQTSSAQTPATPKPGTVVPPPQLSGPFTLPALPYAADALEPHLDAQTMTIHHDKHHAGYVANLNKAIAGKPGLESRSLESLVSGVAKLPEDVQKAVRNHGGGHHNHSLFWTSLARTGARAPRAELAAAIDAKWGSFSSFQERFNAAALSVFGSGWAWLVLDPKRGLELSTSPNQDSPLMSAQAPLLGLDVWEHAYYLKYQNRRAEYVAAFAQVVDWDVVTARYVEAIKG